MHFSWSSTRLLTLSALYSDQMLILLDFPNVRVFRMCRVIQWPNVAERISAMRTQNPTVKIYKQQPLKVERRQAEKTKKKYSKSSKCSIVAPCPRKESDSGHSGKAELGICTAEVGPWPGQNMGDFYWDLLIEPASSLICLGSARRQWSVQPLPGWLQPRCHPTSHPNPNKLTVFLQLLHTC